MTPAPHTGRRGTVPQFRLVLAVSVDGRLAPPEGGAAKLGGAADRRVLEECLAWADACLVGAGTLRIHGSTCLIHGEDLLQQRRQQGRALQPHLVVVSRHGQLDGALPLWRQPLQRWWLVPGQSQVDGDQVPTWCQGVIPLPHWQELPQAMARKGWQRLVVLGGAQLATTLMAHDLLPRTSPHPLSPVAGGRPSLAAGGRGHPPEPVASCGKPSSGRWGMALPLVSPVRIWFFPCPFSPMSPDQLPTMVKCTTRHVRIFTARVDNGVLVPADDKLTLDVDPDNEFLWNDDALQQVQKCFREQVEAYAGRPLDDYNLRRIGTTLENLIRQLLQSGVIAYNPDGRVMNYSMGLPQQDTSQPR